MNSYLSQQICCSAAKIWRSLQVHVKAGCILCLNYITIKPDSFGNFRFIIRGHAVRKFSKVGPKIFEFEYIMEWEQLI